jgi:hypothetical protein
MDALELYERVCDAAGARASEEQVFGVNGGERLLDVLASTDYATQVGDERPGLERDPRPCRSARGIEAPQSRLEPLVRGCELGSAASELGEKDPRQRKGLVQRTSLPFTCRSC